MVKATAKTSWFHLGIVLIATMVSFYIIKNAFAKPFAQFETYNQIRVAEIRAAGG